MTGPVALKLLGIFVVVAIGYLAGRRNWLGGDQAATVLSNTAFLVFVPALLFRTTAELDFAGMPWAVLAAFFGPALAWLLATYLVQRVREPKPPAGPAIRAITVTFGNTVQVGIPVVTALFGAAGLRLHVAIVSLHALLILTPATALVEVDLARAQARDAGAGVRVLTTLATTVRNTVIHPVVLPVLAGLAWNLLGGHLLGRRLPVAVDDVLQTLSQAVVPVCLVLIGVSLAHYGVRGKVRGAVGLAGLKLLAMPGLVLLAGHVLFRLSGLPLAVAVLCAALPVGSNALLFAQRYRSLEGETTAAIVLSTVAFGLSLPLWLLVLGRLGLL